MPTEPHDDHHRDESFDHVVKNLFDVELKRLAFSRPRTEPDRQHARAAVRELARRAADTASRHGEPSSGLPADRPHLDPAVSAHGVTHHHRGAPPWRNRTSAFIIAGILGVIVVVSTVVSTVVSFTPTLSTVSGEASSLDIFASEATPEESDLRDMLRREGLRLTLTPRIIATTEGARILAYRFVVSSSTERPRNEVCLLLIDERALGLPACTERATFLRDGAQATLTGLSQRFVVRWGPTGGPTVSVLPNSDALPRYPVSAAAEAFFTDTQSQSDVAYSDLLRVLYPDDRLIVRVLSTTPTWDVVGTLVASADSGIWSYCVHLFQSESELSTQVGASVTCAERLQFEQEGLVALARVADARVTIEWRPDDTVLVNEFDAP